MAWSRTSCQALNLDVPRTAKQQAKQGLAVTKDTSRLLPGDLLTFGKTKKSPISHVGIYVGDGRYIHASSVAGKVIESAIDRPYSPLIKGWRGARRIVAGEDSVPAIRGHRVIAHSGQEQPLVVQVRLREFERPSGSLSFCPASPDGRRPARRSSESRDG